MSLAVLVLGGARSGKSRYAEALAAGHQGPRVYLATAEAFDQEMTARIAAHREQRAGRGWRTIEAPVDLAPALAAADAEGVFILIDCVTVWLGNLIHYGRDLRGEVERLVEALRAARAKVAVVANETGLGIVPDTPLARRFRDEAGFANQCLARAADDVVLIVAGLPLVLKSAARPHQASQPQTTSAPDRKA